MKTIRNQVKYPKGLWLLKLLYKSIKTCLYSIFYVANKNKKKDNKQKFN